MRRGQQWWILLRWETTGRHAHEIWHHSADVETECPQALAAWGVTQAQRRKSQVWFHGGTHEEECPPTHEHTTLDTTWIQVCEGYSKLMHNLYLECIKSDRTRQPKFIIRLPDVCFWRWVYYSRGDVWQKLVVRYVSAEEEQQADGGVDVNNGDDAPMPGGMVLAPGQALNVGDLPMGPIASDHPIAQQPAEEMAKAPNAPIDTPRRRVFKQVYQIYWSDIESATALMGGNNPHKLTAVKPSGGNHSWKWYRVSIGDIKAEYDGNVLTFTQFPIEAYQSKIVGNRQVADKSHPLLTTTRRRQLDPSA